MRRLLLLAPLLLAACGGNPPVTEVSDRWPASVDTLSPVPAGTSERYEEVLLDSLDGVDEVELFRLDEAASVAHFDVVMLRSDDGFSADEVNQLRCDVHRRLGVQPHQLEDEYAGEHGMHGSGGHFGVDADGVAVLVTSRMDEADARRVAEALGGEDDPDVEPCTVEDEPKRR